MYIHLERDRERERYLPIFVVTPKTSIVVAMETKEFSLQAGIHPNRIGVYGQH